MLENDGVGDETEGWIGGRAGNLVDSITFTPYNDWLAFFHVPYPGTPCRRHGAAGAQVIANPDYVHPEGQFNVDSLYILANSIGADNIWGTHIRTDTVPEPVAEDISVILVSGHDGSLMANKVDTVGYAFGMASSGVSTEDLEATIDALRALSSEACQREIECPIVMDGDVNESGALTAADIIFMVQHVFKGGDPPAPCAATGDVNCSGANTTADIIYLVQHVFKGGPPPCDICWEPGAMECVI
jgi:hypothetical protein